MSKNRIFILNDPYAPRLNSQLAEEIGLNESILLLQLEYWISISNNIVDGHIWTYQSASSIQNMFSFYSTSTINRTLKNLLEMELIIEGNYNKKKFDRTRWFTLNYENLSKLRSIKIEGYDYSILLEEDPNKLQIDINQNALSTNQIEPSTSHNDSCQTQNDSRQTQYASCQTQNESTIPKTTTNIKDLKDSPKSKTDVGPPLKNYDDELYKITDMIIDKILSNHPKAAVPEKDKESKFYVRWVSDVDKLHRLGAPKAKVGYSYREIKDISRFALNDSFWLLHIQSPAKLREKIITLEAQYKARLTNSKSCKSKPDTSKNQFHNFTKSNSKYTNDELEKMLGVK